MTTTKKPGTCRTFNAATLDLRTVSERTGRFSNDLYEVDGQLKPAFELVQAESHWKDEINAVVRDVPLPLTGPLARLIRTAVEFYTATTPDIRTVPQNGIGCGLVVTAAGYRNGPAGG